jgi:hypothetical protein
LLLFEFASKDGTDRNLDEITKGNDLLGVQLDLKKKDKTLSTFCFPFLIEAMTFVQHTIKSFKNKLTFYITQDRKKPSQNKKNIKRKMTMKKPYLHSQLHS